MIRLHAQVITALTLGTLMVPGTSSGQAAVELLPVLDGLSSPVLVTHAGDNTNRLFIVEQIGAIQVLSPGSTSRPVFDPVQNAGSWASRFIPLSSRIAASSSTTRVAVTPRP